MERGDVDGFVLTFPDFIGDLAFFGRRVLPLLAAAGFAQPLPHVASPSQSYGAYRRRQACGPAWTLVRCVLSFTSTRSGAIRLKFKPNKIATHANISHRFVRF